MKLPESSTVWYKQLILRRGTPATRSRRPAWIMGAAIVLLIAAQLCPAPLQADPLLTYPLRIGEYRIRAEVANTPDLRRKGLMFRQQLAAGSGMIFVFPREQRISMWMKNTAISLSVAFIDRHGRIINIEKMHPMSEDTHSSAAPAKYALETNQGWFESHGIKSGDPVSGLERLPPAQ